MKEKCKKHLNTFQWMLEQEKKEAEEVNADAKDPEVRAKAKQLKEDAEARYKQYKIDLKKQIRREYEAEINAKEYNWGKKTQSKKDIGFRNEASRPGGNIGFR